jgi:hypothetical protein
MCVWRQARNGKVKRRVLYRGLKLKAGCDSGRVTAAVNPTTGRMDYRGRAMNRAARVASKAATGQVVCSAAAWDAAEADIDGHARTMVGTSVGEFPLKGLSDTTEIFHVQWGDQAEVPAPSSPRRRFQPHEQEGQPHTHTADCSGSPAALPPPSWLATHPLPGGNLSLSVGGSATSRLAKASTGSRSGGTRHLRRSFR